jgi:hypothetical protein
MENEFGVGRHNTTHSELYRIGSHIRSQNDEQVKAAWVADTPGFNLAELAHPEPQNVFWQFPELAALAPDCKFSNCLHVVEQGCNVIANRDKLSEARYESYCLIVKEAQNEYNRERQISQKIEANVKVVGGKEGKSKHIPRLSGKYRAQSRRTERQKLSHDPDHEGEPLVESENSEDA